MRRGAGAQGAVHLRRITHVVGVIGAAGRTTRNRTLAVKLKVVRDGTNSADRVTIRLAVLQGPGCDRPVELTKIGDATVGLRRRASFNKVGNRNRCKQPNNGHNDHDFHQCEARSIASPGCFHGFSSRGVNKQQAGYIIITTIHSLPVTTACNYFNMADVKNQLKSC